MRYLHTGALLAVTNGFSYEHVCEAADIRSRSELLHPHITDMNVLLTVSLSC